MTETLRKPSDVIDLPERPGYRMKRLLLGPSLGTAQLREEKLSRKAALGVLSSDCISSSAYGSEEMLIVLLGVFGLAGFRILMPLTAVVLVVLALMTLLYREVVMVYTKAGGSYVVARENFGPKVAQVASVALLIDYIVTVAVQTAAGTAAITSLVPALSGYTTEITVGVVLLLAYGNLRGVREAAKAFAFPTYFFVGMAGLVVAVGLLRELFGDLPRYQHVAGMIDVTDKHHAIFSGLAVFVLLKAFANGGSSLTGLEAISNSVSAFRPPEGRNARSNLSILSVLLGSLVLGISYLAWQTHATPYGSGSPTVISQVARAAFGGGAIGHLGFVLVQVATALILYTGANTPFTGFPFLASFIAEDSFLPRQMTRRGHRLAHSNGILVLTGAALTLLLGVGAHVDKLVPFYAIGVFTGFTMAGFGMARYYQRHPEPGWRRNFVVSMACGFVAALVVVIFAVVKFTAGAWLIVVLFPVMWFGLVRLNTQYRSEARALDLVTAGGPDAVTKTQHYPRHAILVLVDRLDIAVIRALRYAGSLHPTELRAVHLVLDPQAAAALQRDWIARGLGDRVPLELVDCPDRRLARGVSQVALRAVLSERAEVTVLLPRRTFRSFSQRILHDRTADRIAAAVGRLPHVSATIVPFDTTLAPDVEERLERRQAADASTPALAMTDDRTSSGTRELPPAAPGIAQRGRATTIAPTRTAPDGTAAINTVGWKQQVTIEGWVKVVQVGTVAGKSLEAQVFDDTGGIRLLFFGRTAIAGIVPGARLRASGRIGEYKGHLALANPRYELLAE
ncbi:amino acid permease [Jatrophihabitans lederbergiae]|uniref:Amino acid permease n=1 Tax=Jatrophihabitans lederbergiae TaxID=3075547 RepID=A0ABU2J6G1_9ACTN|nr:amino acid permease [Jatrophihabitans sp. DSM 44399]MDT0260581.1 amino acid permease [Jatrophihabitans sp. DSM 44399]